MRTKAWTCDGCTNICYMIYNGEVGKYCRANYENPDGKIRIEWRGDECFCLDRTTDPEREDKQIRIWGHYYS